MICKTLTVHSIVQGIYFPQMALAVLASRIRLLGERRKLTSTGQTRYKLNERGERSRVDSSTRWPKSLYKVQFVKTSYKHTDQIMIKGKKKHQMLSFQSFQ